MWFKSYLTQMSSPQAVDQSHQTYVSEKLDNFRWISRIFGTYGPTTLTESSLLPESAQKEIEDTGQFAEIIYSTLPLSTLLENFQDLTESNPFLSRFDALQNTTLEGTCKGSVANLAAAVFFNTAKRQLIISISGTASASQLLQDLRVRRVPHHSGHGSVHVGFLDLYNGIQHDLLRKIGDAISKHSPEKIIVTGHSMGGSLAYLLCIDLLSPSLSNPQISDLSIVTFGAPRTGDAEIVKHFQNLVRRFRQRNSFVEYAVKGYNDGIPCVPPFAFGYRHFCAQPVYTIHGKLYKIPPEDAEHCLFHVEDEGSNKSVFSEGGHNYYNRRDLEGFRREMDGLANTS